MALDFDYNNAEWVDCNSGLISSNGPFSVSLWMQNNGTQARLSDPSHPCFALSECSICAEEVYFHFNAFALDPISVQIDLQRYEVVRHFNLLLCQREPFIIRTSV